MEIEMKTKKILHHVVDYNEWERVVNEFYKPTPEWDFVSDHEASNDSDYSFNVNGKVDVDDEKRLEAFRKDSLSQSFMTRRLLNDLCKKGLIPEGVYLIRVGW